MDRMVNILLITDEDYVKERISDMFKEDFVVSIVSEAKKARELLSVNSYDIVITDSLIYGLTSLEVNKLVKEKSKNSCVIVISDLSTIELAQKTINEGAFAVVLKPPELEKIKSYVKLYCFTK